MSDDGSDRTDDVVYAEPSGMLTRSSSCFCVFDANVTYWDLIWALLALKVFLTNMTIATGVVRMRT